METFEDEDDTHFCNKCHATINGLDNYVRHRQSGCRTSVVVSCPTSTPSATVYPEIPPDEFFSSLDLQSSSKQSHPRRSTDQLNTQPRRSGRNLERKKKQRPEDKDESKEKLPNLLPVVADFDDLALPSLGFPELVAKPSTSKKKPLGGAKVKHEQLDCKRQHDDHREQNDGLNDSMLTGLEEHKEDLHEEHLHHRYDDYDYQQDEESDTESLEAESDSYSDSDEQDNPQYPPRSHTGGKWKPGGATHEHVMRMHHDDDDDEMEHHEHPPPSYTGGKWKLPIAETITAQPKSEEYECKEAAASQQPQQQQQQQRAPPPGHTRGKWVPGARADIGGAAGYWCSPCGRRLASRLVYERHLLSDLHARRSIQEIDGAALQMPVAAVDAEVSVAQRGVSLRRRQKTTKKQSETRDSSSSSSSPETKKKKKKVRQRAKEVLTCETCRARVRRNQMGKHLLSHYHCRVSAARPTSPRAAQRFLLENMANVVRQCPFQCASCRFYCNTEDTFLRHWRSRAHRDTVSTIEGSFVCALCDFWCEDNESLEAHIMKQGHRDVASMINGSVPIVIRRQRVLTCSTCCRRFRYNIQLRYHAKESGHALSNSASDEYQNRLSCDICGQLSRSLIALQRHQLTCHKPDNEEVAATKTATPYFCSFCSLTFKTAHEAVLHRRTLAHKERVKSKKSNEETTPRICSHCEEEQRSLAEYKVHLLQKHPESCHGCAKCGDLFALSQDVTRHTRENRCVRGNIDRAKQWSCSECPFASESRAEHLFHEILHGGPSNNEASKYGCSICGKSFAKTTLRDHLRKHTGEKPFPCGKCDERFMRRSAAKAHQRQCEGRMGRSLEEEFRERKFACSECGDAFHTKHTLRQHMLRHSGKQYKCGLPGCPTILRTETELRTHRKLVHETSSTDRNFQCDNCPYAAKTKIQLDRHRKRHEKPITSDGSTAQHCCPYPDCSFQTNIGSHLKRHVRLHTGQKPYKCRHCDYASNNLENLRKHVLSTTKHPGKMIYQCESCQGEVAFQTNFSRELKAHLLAAHSDKYPTTNHATNYISSIFDASCEMESCDK